MRRSLSLAAITAVTLVGCGDSSGLNNNGFSRPDGSLQRDGSLGRDSGPGSDADIPNLTAKVYAHSADTLFEIDPDNLTVTVVGSFGWPAGSLLEQMTDIALDEEGNMVGISFTKVYRVDKTTAECTYLADLQAGLGGFNGLSWVEGVGIEEKELMGTNQSGEYVRIDPLTGASSQVGQYGGGYGSSGDLVFVRGAGTFATATHTSYSSDVLVSIDAPTGTATLIGEIGYNSIWGLAFWGGQLFGFTDAGQFITIDKDTGQGSLVESTSHRFWGAGVTTTAPIVR